MAAKNPKNPPTLAQKIGLDNFISSPYSTRQPSPTPIGPVNKDYALIKPDYRTIVWG